MSETVEEDSQVEQPYVMSTLNEDGSADFTISFADDDHKFSVSPSGDTAWVEYEESLDWRGEVRVSEQDEAVWKMLMQSDEMTSYLDENDLSKIRRKR